MSQLSSHEDKIIENINDHGIHIIPNFLPKKRIQELSIEGIQLMANNYDFCRYYTNEENDNNKRVNIVPTRVNKLEQNWEKLKEIKKEINSNIIQSVAAKYLGSDYILTNFIYDYSEKTQKELFPLHFDSFKGKKCIKCYYYLRDCNKENGAFRYIPGSHILTKKIFELGIELEKDGESNYRVILNCKDKKFLDYINKSPKANKAFNLLRDIKLNEKLSYEYCVEGKAGTLLLFDTIGVHGGVSIKKGSRYISRIHFVEKSFQGYLKPSMTQIIKSKIKKFLLNSVKS